MLLKKANTITTPTAYSNGFLHSVKPEVVENLLLQSNQFDTSWVNSGTISKTSGQSGYDGSSDAWLLTKSSASAYIYQSVSTGLNTISIYAKSGSLNWLYILKGGNSGQYFNLSTGVLGSSNGPSPIDASIEDVGGGWYRCSLTYIDAFSGSLRFYPADANLDVSGTSGSIYIQDAQLNKGATAYPYLETTTEAKPSADFTFTRNSSATRVNELGYIEDVQIIGGELVSNGDFEEIGSELVTNGSFDTDSDWDKEGEWSISGGVALVPNLGTRSIYQSIETPNTSKIYKITYEIVTTNGGNFRFSYGGVNGTIRNNTGVFTEYIKPISSVDSNIYFDALNVFIGSIDNVSVKEVGQDWTFGTGWTMGDGVVVGTSVNKQFMQQPFTFVSGKKYRTTCTVTGTDTLTNDLCFRLPYDGKTVNIAYATKGQDGVYTHEFVSTGGSFVYFGYIDTGTFTGTVDNISVKEVTDDTNLPRINYEGFTYAESLGDDLTSPLDFTVGWNNIDAINITQNSFEVEGSGRGLFYSLEVDKIYKVKVSNVSGDFSIRYRTLITGAGTVAGNFDEFITINTSGSTNPNIYLRGNDATIVTVGDVSVQEVIGDLPVPYSGKGHLLLEPQTSQILPYSEDFSQWVSGGDTAIESGYSAPDGSNNAFKVSGTTSALQLNSSLLETTTRSIYARTVSGTGVAHLCSFNGNSNNLFTITEQWQRFEVNSAISTGASTFYAVDFRGGTNLSEIILWGANATNDQTYATSYIPTNGTAVTRLGETCNNATQSFPSEGVLYAEINQDNDAFNTISISDGSANNRVTLAYTADSIRAIVVYGGVVAQIITYNNTQGEYHKVGIRYTASNVSLFINGILDSTISKSAFSADLDTLEFAQGNGGNNFYGKTKMVATFPYLSNDEMECLTGEGYGTFEALAAAYSYTIK